MLTSLSINHGGLGRFGNTMFTIAGVIGIACKSGQPFGFPEWKITDNALFGQPVDNMNDYFVNQLPGLNGVPEKSFMRIPYFWGWQDLKFPHGNYDIFAHLQDERYFKDYLPLVRHYFRMKDEPEQNDCVAIHYRAGDYIDDKKAYHPRQQKEYYNEAMDMFPKGTSFKIFSDNIIEAYEVLGMRSEYYPDPVQSYSYIDDFKLMKRCKSFITANSSFSLMAAILGEYPDKKIICPSLWFGEQANGLKFDGYPKEAIII